MKRLLVGLALFCGCSQSAKFEDPGQELEYLQSLSNPTPEQFLRKKELQTLAERRRQEERDREWEADRPRWEAEQQAKQKQQQEDQAGAAGRLLAKAKEYETTNPGLAARYYRDLAKALHGTPEGQQADANSRALWKRAYPSIDYEE